jgi:hypothetical protein
MDHKKSAGNEVEKAIISSVDSHIFSRYHKATGAGVAQAV